MEKIHSKAKGNIGELIVAAFLSTQGYAIFKEFGDLSKIDLIAEKKRRCLRIQVKAIASKDDILYVDSRKSGPNYSFRYEEGMLGIFAVYVPDKQIILFIALKDLLKNKTTTSFRFEKPKNNQKNYHLVNDYLSLDDAITRQFSEE